VTGTDELAITEVATTMKACDEAATTLEAQYLAALGNVATYELSGDALTLRDSAGSTQVTYTIAA
jgi:heat shock protein HslJ